MNTDASFIKKLSSKLITYVFMPGKVCYSFVDKDSSFAWEIPEF